MTVSNRSLLDSTGLVSTDLGNATDRCGMQTDTESLCDWHRRMRLFIISHCSFFRYPPVHKLGKSL